MDSELKRIQIPYHSLLHGQTSCHDNDHIFLIEKYHCDILNAIHTADSVLPRKKHGLAKHFWTEELSQMKQRSVDAYSLWKLDGCPRSGITFLEKNNAHLQYKRALRKAKVSCDREISDELSYELLSHNSEKFWQNWNRIESRNYDISSMDGKISHLDIANTFANTFSKVYSNADNVAESSLKTRFDRAYNEYNEAHENDNISPFLISWSEFLVCISKVKTGKATGSFVKPQHLLHSSPLLSFHLHLLFNALIQHQYVPTDFLHTIVTPIIKDTGGNHSDSTNYRPVTLSSLFSQLFEHAISIKVKHLLWTDYLQFGFKAKHSTSHALFMLNETVDYFTKHNSNVFVTFLDCSKAFDKVSHNGLFLKLIERNVPLCFLHIFMYWLTNLSSQCRWRATVSDAYHVLSGVKQGGILSPILFTVYMNDLLILLRNKGIGCHINRLFLGSIMFADDLVLCAPSRSAMQILIAACSEYCTEFGLSFNTKKSKSLIFGRRHDSLHPEPLFLNNEPIEYVDEWKYLGCLVKSGKQFSFSCRRELATFRCSVNSIVSAVKKPSEQVAMKLLYTFSIPILTYACEVKRFSCSEMHDCHVAVNNAIRKVFSFNRWESIRSLRILFGYKDLYTIFAVRRKSFLSKLPSMGNRTVASLYRTIGVFP